MSSRSSAGAALLRVALAALGLCAAGALAQGLTPAEIPDTLPEAQKTEFQGKRAGIDTRRAQLGAAVALHNARCRGLPENSPLAAECRAAQLELNASVASYRAALDDYNRDLAESAQAAQAKQAARAAQPFDLQGHRGARGLAPENTLAAFAAALSLGVTTLELDTGVTRDGVVVVYHDRTLNPDITRALDGGWLAGRGPALRSLDYAELSQFDVGRLREGSEYAAAQPAQKPADGARIPRLAEVFALARKAGNERVRFNIETKLSPQAPGETLPPVEFARAVVAEIRKAGLADRATVQSFDWRTLAVVQAEAPEIATVHLTGSKFPDAPNRVKQAGGKIWSPYFLELNIEKLKEAHALGLQVVVWTVNEPAQIAAMLDLGVDGIISDRPDLVRAEMAKRGMPLPQPTPVLP
jgi:glycerophosphoryl diester phosphodiesterase